MPLGPFMCLLGKNWVSWQDKKRLIKIHGARGTLEMCGDTGRETQLEHTALQLERNWGHCR